MKVFNYKVLGFYAESLNFFEKLTPSRGGVNIPSDGSIPEQ